MAARERKVSFLPVTSVLITEDDGSRWIDLYALMESEVTISGEEITKVKATIDKGNEARHILSNMKKYYEQEIQSEISGESDD